MEMISEISSTTNIFEVLRLVWMEVAMASLAATVYFTFTGWLAVPGKKGKPAGFSKSSLEQPRKPMQKPIGRTADNEPTMHQIVTKLLRQGKVNDAIALLTEQSECVDAYVPANLAPRLLMAAAKSPDFDSVMVNMRVFAGKIESRSFEAVVLEAAKNKDVAGCCQLRTMAGLLSIPQSEQTLCALAKGLASDVAALRSLIEEVEAPLQMSFAKAVLEAAATLKDVDLASEVFEKVAEGDAAALRDVVEKAATTAAAPVAQETTSMKDFPSCCKEIRSCGKQGDLAGAIKAFESHHKQPANSLMYNSIMEACIECGSLEKALEYFAQARSSGVADVISYNTAMKGHLAHRQMELAKEVFAEISEKGLTPTLVSYHLFLNFHSTEGDRRKAWKVVEEMQSAGIPPTAVTCSILLKGKLSSPSDIEKVLGFVDTITPMDEVLFHTLAEACIRTGQLQTLKKYQDRLASQEKSPALSAPTYGVMIKAYGQGRDVKHVWGLWQEMIKHDVQPTTITIGCMVEALVANWQTAAALELVQEIAREESTRSLVNTVIYSTILKGFAYAKETDKVMAVYEEMKAKEISPNNITYNTILNAFAHGGAMDRVPALLEDMKKASPPAEPDLVTLSTIIKGYCNSGCLDRALEIFRDIQSTGTFTADEVLYNTLLDGCAKEHRPNDAIKLLDEMRRTGVAPSNYTLSMLVKLMGRCKRLNQAFSIVEDISREYGLKVNIQVYTCLIQACFNNRQAAKAVAVHDQIIKEGLSPDEMVYTVLVKGCVQAHLIDKAVQLTRCAYGLDGPKVNRAPGIKSNCLDELTYALGGSSKPEAAALLTEIADGQAGASASRHQGKGTSKGRESTPPWRHLTEIADGQAGGAAPQCQGKDTSKGRESTPPWRQRA